ncbi:GyrI-like domain-containing protein [Gillisia sp. CAL575]|uniref:GyrI-like domain-containing protein n=1 Tax=Gillisia sp. CAL575 TaxID=985255 RepID=UPI00054DE3BF|nr:GyrI-like domain-containing protein [Gillisia sp. CAL575]
MPEPIRIENISQIKLVGKRKIMSFSSNQTPSLWKSFMPRKKEVLNTLNANLYSIEIYKLPNFFEDFDPTLEFEKWAAVEVSNFNRIPSEMESLIIPAGKYAVFKYKGKGSEASVIYKSVLQDWLPNSEFQLDHRPHFAVMGEKYRNEDPTSEEEIWFPIKD